MAAATLSNPARPSARLAALLPPGVATAELTGTGDPALLSAGERLLLEEASPLRSSEFAAGRLCARRAVASFGVVDCPIPIQPDRRPQWPLLLTGSITHTRGFSAAAVGERRRFRAIGIDAERIDDVTSDVWSHVLTPAELEWVGSLPGPVQAKSAALIFSAKEAFYKCQYEATQQWLEFADVTLDFFGRNLAPSSLAVRPVGRVVLDERYGASAVVRFAFTRDLVLTAVALDAH